MDEIPSLQELLAALEQENRDMVARRVSLLRSSGDTIAQQPETIHTHPSPCMQSGAGLATKAPFSMPQNYVTSAGGQSQASKPLLLLTGLAGKGDGFASGGAASSGSSTSPPRAEGSVLAGLVSSGTGTNDPELLRILDGLIKKRQLTILKKLANPGATQGFPSPGPQVPRIGSVPAPVPTALPSVGQAMNVSTGMIPGCATAPEKLPLPQLLQKMTEEEQKGEALRLALKTLQGHSPLRPQDTIGRDAVIPTAAPLAGDDMVTNNGKAVVDELLSRLLRQLIEKERSRLLLETLSKLEGHSLPPRQDNRVPVSPFLTELPSLGVSPLAPRRSIVTPPADTLATGRLPSPKLGRGLSEETSRLMIGPFGHRTQTNLAPNALAFDVISTASSFTTSFEGDPIVPVALDGEDNGLMSKYQCLFRQQLVFVAVNNPRNDGKAQGRSKPVVPGQVGLHCRYCALVPLMSRVPGACYFPSKLDRIYQASINIGKNHFQGRCPYMPENVRKQLKILKEQKQGHMDTGVGKAFWAEAALQVGVQEGEDGLFFGKNHNKNNMKRSFEENGCQDIIRPQKAAKKWAPKS